MNINTKHMAKYKKLGSVTLFDAQTTKENLSELGNPLERLSQVIDFEMFRGALEERHTQQEETVRENRTVRNHPSVVVWNMCLGLRRAFKNMLYNFFRLEQIVRLGIN